ncbi:hypothetical protein JYU13_00925, partial [Gammaproteobacteria bacterium AH-315-M22]|nr:hypothetical protein [Gammaproteobacteria bacterium AH-315-M22]
MLQVAQRPQAHIEAPFAEHLLIFNLEQRILWRAEFDLLNTQVLVMTLIFYSYYAFRAIFL